MHKIKACHFLRRQNGVSVEHRIIIWKEKNGKLEECRSFIFMYTSRRLSAIRHKSNRLIHWSSNSLLSPHPLQIIHISSFFQRHDKIFLLLFILIVYSCIESVVCELCASIQFHFLSKNFSGTTFFKNLGNYFSHMPNNIKLSHMIKGSKLV